MTPQEWFALRIATLQAHEWAYKEGMNRVYCETCGQEHAAAKFLADRDLTHRKGCFYAEIIQEARAKNTI